MKELLVNLTPHDVTILNDKNEPITTFKSQGVVRLKTTSRQVATIEIEGYQVPVNQTVFGDVQGLPQETKGFKYIVSQLVKSALPDRNDLLVPDGIIRDDKGVIIGCKSFR